VAGSPEPTEADDRAARRVVLLAAVALVAVLVGAVVVAITQAVRTDGGGDASAISGEGATPSAAEVTSVGPARGLAVPTYLDARRAALTDAEGVRLAVVSFGAYRTEAGARAAVAGGPLVVQALLAAVPGGAPSTVAGALADWAKRIAADAIAERDEIAKLLPTVDDAEFTAFYQAELIRLDKLTKAASPGGELVFGLVVSGPASALRALAGSGGVRLVDVGLGAKPASGVTYTGLRPEEQTKTGDPDLRPA
jgi:hypothetical protein